ncbi:DUF4352 domain-containing protein [Streptomyces atratus]|uniref:DUF4352 domain-containing protein n=1 Tax=Streptomyces atratus TaxID=1893 RepID=UPI0036609420
MSQQNPGQPQWGPQQPQAYSQPYGPAPQQPKKSNTGKIVGLGCLGIIVLFIVIGIIASVAGGGDSKDETSKAGSSASDTKKADDKPQEKQKEEEKAPADSPVKIVATPTKFTPSILHDGGEYTSVKVTITNNSEKKIGVNPLYFAITDKSGSKHTAELAVDDNQMNTTDLAPGENMTGVITGKGKFTAAYVTYTDGLLGDSVKGDVK